MAVKYTASDVVALAKTQIGYAEKASNANLDDFTANAGYNNFTKYSRDIALNTNMYNGNKQGAEWCDVFVDWLHYTCAINSGGTWHDAQTALCQPDGGCGAGCYYSYNYYKSAGRASSSPAIGAQIFFCSGSDITHTGIVTGFDSSTVYTIEGNTRAGNGVVVASGGGVYSKYYPRSSSYIYGYGLPKYASASSSASSSGTSYNASSSASSASTVASTSSYTRVDKIWRNGSTDETVYSCTNMETKTGSLDPYEAAWCEAKVNGKYLVTYRHDADGAYKTGFVEYAGGISV